MSVCPTVRAYRQPRRNALNSVDVFMRRSNAATPAVRFGRRSSVFLCGIVPRTAVNEAIDLECSLAIGPRVSELMVGAAWLPTSVNSLHALSNL